MINSAINANLSMQANYTTTTATGVNTYDNPNVWSGLESGEAGELEQQQQTNAQQDVSGTRTAQKSTSTQQSSSTQQSGSTSEAGAASQSGNAGETSETAARTLRLAMADNSKELQARFSETQSTRGDQQANMSQDVRRQVMLRNMENMVNLQLAQYTGNEPYSKANYREILGAMNNMQGDNKTKKEEKTSSNGSDTKTAGKAEEKDGAYKLYSGQAAKTLASLNQNPRGGGDDAFNMVA